MLGRVACRAAAACAAARASRRPDPARGSAALAPRTTRPRQPEPETSGTKGQSRHREADSPQRGREAVEECQPAAMAVLSLRRWLLLSPLLLQLPATAAPNPNLKYFGVWDAEDGCPHDHSPTPVDGYYHYPNVGIATHQSRSACPGGDCAIKTVAVASVTECEAACNATAKCVAVQLAHASSGPMGCTLLYVGGPGAGDAARDTYVAAWAVPRPRPRLRPGRTSRARLPRASGSTSCSRRRTHSSSSGTTQRGWGRHCCMSERRSFAGIGCVQTTKKSGRRCWPPPSGRCSRKRACSASSSEMRSVSHCQACPPSPPARQHSTPAVL